MDALRRPASRVECAAVHEDVPTDLSDHGHMPVLSVLARGVVIVRHQMGAVLLEEPKMGLE